jgi:hypothetical protein
MHHGNTNNSSSNNNNNNINSWSSKAWKKMLQFIEGGKIAQQWKILGLGFYWTSPLRSCITNNKMVLLHSYLVFNFQATIFVTTKQHMTSSKYFHNLLFQLFAFSYHWYKNSANITFTSIP